LAQVRFCVHNYDIVLRMARTRAVAILAVAVAFVSLLEEQTVAFVSPRIRGNYVEMSSTTRLGSSKRRVEQDRCTSTVAATAAVLLVAAFAPQQRSRIVRMAKQSPEVDLDKPETTAQCSVCGSNRREAIVLGGLSYVATTSSCSANDAEADTVAATSMPTQSMPTRSTLLADGILEAVSTKFSESFLPTINFKGQVCEDCGGDMTMRCYRCQGTGQMGMLVNKSVLTDCMECNTTGYKVCGRCYGTGCGPKTRKVLYKDGEFKKIASNVIYDGLGNRKMTEDGRKTLKTTMIKALTEFRERHPDAKV